MNSLVGFIVKSEDLFLSLLCDYRMPFTDLLSLQQTCRALRDLLNSESASLLWKRLVCSCRICMEREVRAIPDFVGALDNICYYWKTAVRRHTSLRRLKAQWGTKAVLRTLVNVNSEVLDNTIYNDIRKEFDDGTGYEVSELIYTTLALDILLLLALSVHSKTHWHE